MHEAVSAVLLCASGVMVAAYAVEGVGFLYMWWQRRKQDPEVIVLTEDDEAFM